MWAQLGMPTTKVTAICSECVYGETGGDIGVLYPFEFNWQLLPKDWGIGQLNLHTHAPEPPALHQRNFPNSPWIAVFNSLRKTRAHLVYIMRISCRLQNMQTKRWQCGVTKKWWANKLVWVGFWDYLILWLKYLLSLL